MKRININRSTIPVALLMLLSGLIIGWLAKPTGDGEYINKEDSVQTRETTEAKTWTCSMDPQIRQTEPGKCPLCGMDLIPLEETAGTEDPLEIRMSPTAMQLANVQTATIGAGNPVREIRMNGKVQPDERLIFTQVAHISGRVEELALNFTGEPVRKGQRLATIYSPELVTAQEELFAAQKIKDMQPQLFTAAREKLKNWKLTDQQIDEILSTGKPEENFPILADVTGIVLNKMVNPGDYLMRGMPLYSVVDLSRVWALFDIYESDIPWVRIGNIISFAVPSLPGEQFSGRINFIDPVINPMTRVATARVEVLNPNGKLKPEMFISGIIKTPLAYQGNSLLVPKSAVLWTGERSVVYVKRTTDQGISFQMREITLGPLAGDNFVVKEGLDAGTEIAVNGAFSIDAAAQLAGKPSMMNPEGGVRSNAHPHKDEAPHAEPIPVSEQAQKVIIQLIERYYRLKDALVEDNLAAALKEAGDLKRAFENSNMALFTGPAHDRWMNHSRAAVTALIQLTAARDLEAARKPFKPLSVQMVAMAKIFGPFEQPVYVQHCPMADNNTGADWLSREEKILNPYFGDKMLTCGSITAIIK